MTEQVREKGWSFDACVGYARRTGKFWASEMVCTKTLYNALKDRRLSLTLCDVPEVLSRRKRNSSRPVRIAKRVYGRSISERSALSHEFGHWEIDTVLGTKARDACILTLVEKTTRYYMALRIYRKNSSAVLEAMEGLHTEYGERFDRVFKSITADNGSEFSEFSLIEKWGTRVYSPILFFLGTRTK